MTRGRNDVEIMLCPDGPLLVRGPVRIVTGDERDVPRPRSAVALCRCGGSAIKPFCDGTHKVKGFTTDDQGHQPDGGTPCAH